MNLWIVLYSFYQILRIGGSRTVSVKRASSSRFGLHWAAIYHIIDVLHMAYPWPSSSWWRPRSSVVALVLWILSLRTMEKLFNIVWILALCIVVVRTQMLLPRLSINPGVCSFNSMLVSWSCLSSSIHTWSIIGVVYTWSGNTIQMLSCVKTSSVYLMNCANGHVSTLVNSCFGNGTVI